MVSVRVALSLPAVFVSCMMKLRRYSPASRLLRAGMRLLEAFVSFAIAFGQQMLVRHQPILNFEAIGPGELLPNRGDLAKAGFGIRMIAMVCLPVAAEARRQLHACDIDGLVVDGRQRVGLALPGRERALEPVRIVALRMVLARVCAAALGTLACTQRNAQRNLEHFL